MPARSPLATFIEPLERLDLPYCITGSVAASVYGEPRLTADIDVVLLLQGEDIPALRAAFPESQYYVPPQETLRLETARTVRGMFNLICARAARTSMCATFASFSPRPRSIVRSSKTKWCAWGCGSNG